MVSGSPGAEQHQKARIWLVDDSPLQSAVAQNALSFVGEVSVFGDGSSMLEQLVSAESPQLLILDWHMPEMSGLEICRFVRQTRDPGELPILILTATGSAESLVIALEAGANDFVMKPFSATELQARVAALLRNRMLHAKLAETQRQLEIEAEFRERFIGMLAHDLRQPLNTFVLANQSIHSASANGLSKIVEMQRRTADRMTRMVNELLDFARSRPETGMPVHPKTVDIVSSLSELIAELRVGHPTQRFEFVAEGDCVGKWDPDRVAQMCGNLIGNALEHGTTGQPISVTIRCAAGNAVLSVSNHGKQIPEHMLSTLFHPYRRGAGASRSSGGVGLGLHIVSEIARAHGGGVDVVSNADVTTFIVTLPMTE
jgi:signal transduction histidine kinase